MPSDSTRGVRRYGKLEPDSKSKRPARDKALCKLIRDHGRTMQPLLRFVYRLKAGL